jgi:hypothetical protein
MTGKSVFLIVLAAVGALLLLAGGVGFWIVVQTKKTDPVTIADAVVEFQNADDGTREVPGAPQPGVYTYDVEGAEAGGAGSVKVSRDLPLQAQMIVWQQAGGYETRLDYSGDHVEGARYVVGDDGIAQTWSRSKLSLLGTTSDDEIEVDPAALWIPEDLSEGATWEASYEADGFSTAHTSRVTGSEPVRVGAEEFDAVVIERTTTYSGDVSGEWTDTYWWSPELRLPVRISVEGESKQGIGVFSQTATLTLSSAEPQV